MTLRRRENKLFQFLELEAEKEQQQKMSGSKVHPVDLSSKQMQKRTDTRLINIFCWMRAKKPDSSMLTMNTSASGPDKFKSSCSKSKMNDTQQKLISEKNIRTINNKSGAAQAEVNKKGNRVVKKGLQQLANQLAQAKPLTMKSTIDPVKRGQGKVKLCLEMRSRAHSAFGVRDDRELPCSARSCYKTCSTQRKRETSRPQQRTHSTGRTGRPQRRASFSSVQDYSTRLNPWNDIEQSLPFRPYPLLPCFDHSEIIA